ncbi:protein kinase [Kitasatospora sp. NPDC058218]|uniref:protein kinase domain-containing protein n=1 Tax=Kitasatospora sp. NPDC058218 TaxID=3346385 RepID=UPI0036D7ACDE
MRVLGGRYRIDAAAGAGGMGEVWRATDLELERTVAVKVLPAALAADPEFRSRFRREARLLGGLRHEGIAVLHDVGEDGGEPFLVMEFVEGRTLARVTGGRPVDCEWALAVVRQLAAALGYSHAQGLIHRDVKPSNVMITASGGVRMLDFGISKALSGSSTRLTGTGTSLGTPAYMSPEQIDGESVDIRTDQYALGCLLHELLTGRPPFVGDSPFAVLNQHLTKQPVGPSRFNGLVPASVDALVLRLLAKAPDGRFRDMAEFVRALDHVQVPAQAAVPVSVPGTPSDSAPDSTAAVPSPTAPLAAPLASSAAAPVAASPAASPPSARRTAVVAQSAFMLAIPAVFTVGLQTRLGGVWMVLLLVVNLLVVAVGTPATWLAVRRRPRRQSAGPPGNGLRAVGTALTVSLAWTVPCLLFYAALSSRPHASWTFGDVGLLQVLTWAIGLGWFALAYALAHLRAEPRRSVEPRRIAEPAPAPGLPGA